MQSITTAAGLKIAIGELEEKQAAEWLLIKEEVAAAYESLKLINVIKSTLRQAVLDPDLKTNIVDTAIALTTGVIAKKTIIGKTKNPFKILLGAIIEMAVVNKIANNAEAIKKVGSIILNRLIHAGENTAGK